MSITSCLGQRPCRPSNRRKIAVAKDAYTQATHLFEAIGQLDKKAEYEAV